MIKTLQLELRSDLCVGTGKHYAAVIDLDTALDAYGIPFIPAKRLKGCMREIAEQILGLKQTELNALFGENGSGTPGSLRITNAKIKGYDNQLDEIKAAIQSGAVSANDITTLFCSVRAETALENDTAKDGTLRFTRVVNRLSPLSDEAAPLTFYAEMEFDEEDLPVVTNICKGLKNIGYKRNRGLGYVHCSLSDPEQSSVLCEKTFDDETWYRLDYLVYLTGELMLPGADANRSADFIAGTSALGAFAAKYIKRYGEEGFNSVFLSGKARFGNLYLSDCNGTDYLPAPRFLAKIKGSDGSIQNMIANEDADAEKDPKPQYKPLKSGYISETNGYRQVETEIVYHNALNTAEARENNGGLYTQYCISAGQYLKGFIEADGSAMRQLYPLLADGRLSFGRSKTAQYARCELKHCEIHELQETTAVLQKDRTAAFVFESDAALMTAGRFSVALNDVLDALNAEVCSAQPVVCEENLSTFTSLSTRVISGYNAKWNLKKPQFPVIRAGSVVVFRAQNDQTLPASFLIGCKKNEGFGRVRLISDAKEYLHACIDPEESVTPELKDSGSSLLQAVEKEKAATVIVETAITDARTAAKRFNPSQTGRLTLMCKESGSIADFEKRIASIKTESFRNNADLFVLKKTREYAVTKDWSLAKKYALTLLTIIKYSLKTKEVR